VLLVVFVALFGLLLDSPAALVALCSVSVLAVVAAPIHSLWKIRAAVVALAVVWSTVLSQGLFYGDEPRVPVVEWGPLVVWREGLLHGLVQSMRLVAAGLAGMVLATTTPMDRLHEGLVALRVPRIGAFLAVTALRSVPAVGEELLAVRAARAARGRPLLPRSPWGWLEEEMRMLRPVVARAVRRARTLADSLDARGFDRSASAPARLGRPMPVAERVGILALAIAWIALLAAEVLTWAYRQDLLYFPWLRPLYGAVRTWF
jgi:energy-coupling factor transport system permease protein